MTVFENNLEMVPVKDLLMQIETSKTFHVFANNT